MKRFFCTTCKRVKRVRTLPSDVQTYLNADTGEQEATGMPKARNGTCHWHGQASRTKVNDRVRVMAAPRTKAGVVPAKKKS